MFLLSRSAGQRWISRFFIIALLHASLIESSLAHKIAPFPEEFVIALCSKPDSLDPHARLLGPNITLSEHLFDSFFIKKEGGKYGSRILESYESRDALNWVFKLKPDIYFHDGSQMTVKDLQYTINRLLSNTEGDFLHYVKAIKDHEALDPLTLKLTMHWPQPALTRDLARIFVVKHQDTLLDEQSFLEQKAYVGSGPYKLVKKNVKGDFHLVANQLYHSEEPYLKKIRLTYIEGFDQRLHALRTGRVHLLGKVTQDEVKKMRSFENLDIIQAPSHWLIHLQLDTYRDQSPYILTHDGKPLHANPLKKRKVRQAISYALNRDELVKSVLMGAGIPAGQLVRPGELGHAVFIKPDSWSPQKARKLLAEAGYPQGFQLTIHGPNDRYMQDELLLQAIAEQLTQVGIKTKAVSLAKDIYFKAFLSHQYAVGMVGEATNGDLSEMLNLLFYSRSRSNALLNTGRYHNPEVNHLIKKGSQQMEFAGRLKMHLKALGAVMRDKAIIPLHFQKDIWAMRNDLGVDFWPEGGFFLSPNATYVKKATKISFFP